MQTFSRVVGWLIWFGLDGGLALQTVPELMTLPSLPPHGSLGQCMCPDTWRSRRPTSWTQASLQPGDLVRTVLRIKDGNPVPSAQHTDRCLIPKTPIPLKLHGLWSSSSSRHTLRAEHNMQASGQHHVHTPALETHHLGNTPLNRQEGQDSRCGVSSQEHKGPLLQTQTLTCISSANPSWVNFPRAETLHIWLVLNYKPRQVLSKPSHPHFSFLFFF